ncbi:MULTISPECIES: flagellar hook-basal body protein [Bacillaceae]|uniref:flagellar hook-basal body protein n=1 Tax=Bacillaceae TaxID=186817 RepID=UPI001BDF03BA|nr:MULTISPECIES: flagellar hook-basal body protein [Bacillaceae]MDX8361099.1 flagellar hook-basal body protein [Cytobacillus sp. IB215316]
MNRSILTAANTMSQLQHKLDTIGNNLANVDTVGYKRRQASFTELLYQNYNNQPREEQEVGRLTPNGIRIGTGSKLGQTNMIIAQGSLKETNRPLDIAFTEEGQFLRVAVENNGEQAVHYTRNGALYLSPLEEGSDELILVTSDGYPVLDNSGNTINIENDYQDISIDENGTINLINSDGEKVEGNNLSIVKIHRPQLLQSVGGNLLGLPNLEQLNLDEEEVLTLLTDDLQQQIRLQNGTLEQSNVDVSTEMTEMLATQRTYQFNAKSISIADQMMGLVNGIR